MKKEELEYLVGNTLDFSNVDEAFEDFCWEMSAEEIMSFISDEEKERILKTSPSYVKHKDKWYFNGEFQDILDEKEIEKIIEEKEGK